MTVKRCQNVVMNILQGLTIFQKLLMYLTTYLSDAEKGS